MVNKASSLVCVCVCGGGLDKALYRNSLRSVDMLIDFIQLKDPWDYNDTSSSTVIE